MTPKLTVIIVNWNTRLHLERCLQSLMVAAERTSAECIVVDNGSEDGSAAMVRERFPEVRLFELSENLGFAGANNHAIERSRGEYVLLLNPDIYMPEDALQRMVEHLESNISAAAVSASLVGENGRVQTEFYRRFPARSQVLLFYTSLSYATWWIAPLRHAVFDRAIQGRHPVEVDQLPGACCLVRRSVIDQVGLMDPDYFIWFEDVDWSYRMRAAGHRLFVLPEVRMLHAGGASFSGWSSDRRVWQFFLSLFRFLCKHDQKALIAWSRSILRADMTLKETVLRVLGHLPGGARLPLPKPKTLRNLRLAIDELIASSERGELAAFADSGPEGSSAVGATARNVGGV